MTVLSTKVLLIRAALAAAMALGAGGIASAQTVSDSNSGAAPAAASQPWAILGASSGLSADDASKLRQGIDAALSGNFSSASSIQASIADPVARKLVRWAMIDMGSNSGFFDTDAARRELWGWPRANRRQAAAERSLESASLAPARAIAWFEGKEPETAEGAMALISAYQQSGRTTDAESLARHFWRDRIFEADSQSRMLARFGSYLRPEDHAKRLDTLLYGPQGPAARAMLDLVTPDVRALGEARIALRSNRDDASDYVARVPGPFVSDPGLSFERARYYRKRGLDSVALTFVDALPPAPQDGDAGAMMWAERRGLMNAALKAGDSARAYTAVNNHGLTTGADYAEAEFYAGWLALKRLNNPALADQHFANIQKAGTSPITLSRAYYWRGLANEAKGDAVAAKALWTEGGKYYTAFYGQLSAERAGQTMLELPKDPVPNTADRARFEGREQVRAARMLIESGKRDLFRTFVLAIDDTLPSVEEVALLVDMARLYGDQDLAMRVIRTGAQRGLYLMERGYPVRLPQPAPGQAEPALTLSIIRQESGFDPGVRSGPGARGMMQIMPATAQIVARQLGVSYSTSMLDDAEYNMKLGAYHLGDLMNQFSGSYVMTAAGYNAGPGRPTQWIADCGDPRQSSTDPADYIECIPFAETRNYVMRIMEAMEVYRARLNGGTAPLTLTADLKRGGWSTPAAPIAYQTVSLPVAVVTPGYVPSAAPPRSAASLAVDKPSSKSSSSKSSGRDGAGKKRGVDVAAGCDKRHRSACKATASSKKSGKSKATAGLKGKTKVAKAKGKSSKGGGVVRRKARR